MDWENIDLYRFFAFVFGAPSPDRFDWLHRPDLGEQLRGLWSQVQCPGTMPAVAPFKSHGDYESTYISSFDVGVPQPPLPLQESAHYKAVPAQQTAVENTDFYDVLGLATDSSRYPPDHLVTQLEFLAAVRYTRENAPDPENRKNLERLERDFLQRHLLNWVPQAEEKLFRAPVPVFPVLLTLLLAFLRQRAAA